MNETTCKCLGCGVEFTPHDFRQKFCSKACRSQHHSRASYARHADKRIEENRQYRAKVKQSQIAKDSA